MSPYKNEIEKLADQTLLDNKEICKVVGCSIKTVFKYAGSYADRCKAKAKKSEDDFEIQRTVLLPDIHYPHIDNKVLDSVNQFLFDYDPHEIVYMGDQLTLDCISFWNKKRPLLKEGQRLKKDYEAFNNNILKIHENITAPDTRRVFIIGNHENRVQTYIEENPEVEGLIGVDENLKLTERGYKVIGFNGTHRVGKLYVIHGRYWNMYHSKRTVDEFQGNVVYAHVHNPQMFTKISPVDSKDYHMATCLPCLCNIRPDYKRDAPNHWVNGFGIVEHLPATGYFNLYTIIIVDGCFMYNGIYYGKDL